MDFLPDSLTKKSTNKKKKNKKQTKDKNDEKIEKEKRDQANMEAYKKALKNRLDFQLSGHKFNRNRNNSDNSYFDEHGKLVRRYKNIAPPLQQGQEAGEHIYEENRKTIREMIKEIAKDPVKRDQYIKTCGLDPNVAISIINSANTNDNEELSLNDRVEEIIGDRVEEIIEETSRVEEVIDETSRVEEIIDNTSRVEEIIDETREDEMAEKRELIYQLYTLERYGHTLGKRYTMADDINELRFEHDRLMNKDWVGEITDDSRVEVEESRIEEIKEEKSESIREKNINDLYDNIRSQYSVKNPFIPQNYNVESCAKESPFENIKSIKEYISSEDLQLPEDGNYESYFSDRPVINEEDIKKIAYQIDNLHLTQDNTDDDLDKCFENCIKC
jgi:hypothetical protein